MKNMRVRIAFTVFCGMTVLTGYSVRAVHNSCGMLIAQTEKIMQTAAQQRNPEQEIAALEALWEKQSRKLHLFLPHQTLMELNASVARLDALRDADCDELTAELCAVRADLQWINTQIVKPL
ncbi:MAG: DUF4363 family protein [Oscillospiraceae bacterium]|nr:DUF4363 family protein [Oscillospiraceae bacterium]